MTRTHDAFAALLFAVVSTGAATAAAQDAAGLSDEELVDSSAGDDEVDDPPGAGAAAAVDDAAGDVTAGGRATSAEPGDPATAGPGGQAGRTRGDPRDETPQRVRIRHDSILRWAPRHRLTTEERPVGPDRQFWRRIDELPLYERVSLDARGLAAGRVDAHLAAWGALDLTADTEGGIAAGDVAVAYAVGRVGPASAWAGRRFVAWGPPGGLHLDGVGAEVRSGVGIVAEALVGRPVTPVLDTLLGPHASFEGPTVAYGVRTGYADPETASASVAYVERWAEGLPADRVLSLDSRAKLGDRVDVDVDAVFDASALAVEQVIARADWYATDELALDGAYAHVEPGRLLPLWSILAAFSTSTYDEGSIGATVRLGRELAARGEAALRVHDLPDQHVPDDPIGYRLQASLRWATIAGLRARLSGSRRHDGVTGYTLVHAEASVPLGAIFATSLEGGLGVDDAGDTLAVYGRAGAELSLSDDWTVGAIVDVARTPIAAAETRGLLRVTWDSHWGER